MSRGAESGASSRASAASARASAAGASPGGKIFAAPVMVAVSMRGACGRKAAEISLDCPVPSAKMRFNVDF
jgi:hypothetical protein